jgi:uncharacterized protein (TIGR02646 family)
VVRLRRRGVSKPKDWDAKVAKAIGDMAAFLRAARAFQRLPEQDARRVAGFVAYAACVLPVNKKKAKSEFPAVWQKHTKLKQGIIAMSQGYCAYCQVPVTASHPGKTPGQVEHFKPKTRFPVLAYDVRNYFLSCAACNVAKGDKWPRGGYVRPDRGKPEERFVFEEDGTVRARARDGVARRTVIDLELNREGLTELRRVLVSKQLEYVRNYLRANAVGVRLAPPLVETFSPVSEAINQNVRRAWVSGKPKRRA